MTDSTQQRSALASEGPGPSLVGETDAELARRAEHDEDLDLVDLVRQRIDLDERISDVTIAASLAQITAVIEPRERWLAAFSSPIGKHLASRGSDLNTTLNVLIALAPLRQI